MITMGQKECFKIRNISILFLVLMFLSFFNCDGEKDARSKSQLSTEFDSNQHEYGGTLIRPLSDKHFQFTMLCTQNDVV